MKTLADPRQADIRRSAAAAYIASFLARAAFLPEHLLLEATEQLAGWCLNYCRRQEAAEAARSQLAHPPAQGVVHQASSRPLLRFKHQNCERFGMKIGM